MSAVVVGRQPAFKNDKRRLTMPVTSRLLCVAISVYFRRSFSRDSRIIFPAISSGLISYVPFSI